METLFLDTVSTHVFPDPPIDSSRFQVRDMSRSDTIVLRDSDGNERYQLGVLDCGNLQATNVKYPICVWLNPPVEQQTETRQELKSAAERLGCGRVIAVDKRPPGANDDTVEIEINHVVRVLGQNGFFFGKLRMELRKHIIDFGEVHVVSNQVGR